jgi:predicted O-methyltransferase YrrM
MRIPVERIASAANWRTTAAIKAVKRQFAPLNRQFASLNCERGDDILAAIAQPKTERIKRVERERLAMIEDKRLFTDIAGGGIYDKGVTVEEGARISRSLRDGQFLYGISRHCRHACIELGTNVGISSAYLSLGLVEANATSRLVTLESSPARTCIAREVHSRLALPPLDVRIGLFQDTLQHTLEELGTVDVAFIDGHHQYEPTLHYWDMMASHCAPGAFVLFDDTRWSDGMRAAWAVLQKDTRFSAVVDLGWLGVCVVGSGPGKYIDASHLW